MPASAVQQQLMVAALSCEAVASTFVRHGVSAELFAADRALLKFFKRLKARGGETEYTPQDAHGQHVVAAF